MEEYSSCGLDRAGDGGMQFALCKVYVSPKAAPNSDAYKESDAWFATPPPAAPAIITQPVAAKRPAPPQDAMSPCPQENAGFGRWQRALATTTAFGAASSDPGAPRRCSEDAFLTTTAICASSGFDATTIARFSSASRASSSDPIAPRRYSEGVVRFTTAVCASPRFATCLGDTAISRSNSGSDAASSDPSCGGGTSLANAGATAATCAAQGAGAIASSPGDTRLLAEAEEDTGSI
ncbi:uncharacterized protein [Miscanthus floridulus]|uniref:uncharacterized protein n=1 Tax=Miscanthus floridulus TaxID=154761 RepID=UPI00345A045D